MAKRSIKNALSKSLEAEDRSVDERFEKAESILSSSKEPSSLIESKKTEPIKKKVIRDTFTMPEDEYAMIAIIQQRCLQSAHNVARSEIVRAGIKILNELTDEELLKAVKNIEKIKTGRPSRKK